jgi:hypothetical protein
MRWAKTACGIDPKLCPDAVVVASMTTGRHFEIGTLRFFGLTPLNSLVRLRPQPMRS